MNARGACKSRVVGDENGYRLHLKGIHILLSLSPFFS